MKNTREKKSVVAEKEKDLPVRWWRIPHPFSEVLKVDDGVVTSFGHTPEFEIYLRDKAEFGIFYPHCGTDWQSEIPLYYLLAHEIGNPNVNIAFYIKKDKNPELGLASDVQIRREVFVSKAMLGEWWKPPSSESFSIVDQLPLEYRNALEGFSQHAATYWVRAMIGFAERAYELIETKVKLEQMIPPGVVPLRTFSERNEKEIIT